jgi:hypothetical protein
MLSASKCVSARLLGALLASTLPACSDSPANLRADAGTVDVADAASAPPDASADAGTLDPPDAAPDAPSLPEVLEGEAQTATTPRPGFGALLAVAEGPRSYVIESRRDVEPGPYGLPWRSRFRLAAYEAGQLLWAFDAQPDDLIGDVVVHPSGELTLALQRWLPEDHGYELVRLSHEGKLVSTTVLPTPATPPASDYAAEDPRPLFRMQAPLSDATGAGWMRLLAEGEGLAVAFLSFVDAPPDSVLRTRFALGVGGYAWQDQRYVERWARVVEGPHSAEPAAWAYDELRWREQAVRPFFARDESAAEYVVGRAWNNTRCLANVATFAEFEPSECIWGAVGTLENEHLPLAVTRFDALGGRLGTTILRTDEDALEQVPFALAASNREIAVVGSVVRATSAGVRRSYEEGRYVDYDGYLAFYDPQGTKLRSKDFNLGRGDVLASLRWLAHGVVAVGSSGWDRGFGGMSIFRGSDPLLIWAGTDLSETRTRVVPQNQPARHFQLHDVTLGPGGRSLVGHGFSDAPLTHSADHGNTAAKTFGSLTVTLMVPGP